mmetsp:Transcript_24912/g.58033  ORF Transcript_24912/g.58033 Transcript_24912/m.58033 type:complete len:133 (-) Transcript_24912:392-790(-)
MAPKDTFSSIPPDSTEQKRLLSRRRSTMNSSSVPSIDVEMTLWSTRTKTEEPTVAAVEEDESKEAAEQNKQLAKVAEPQEGAQSDPKLSKEEMIKQASAWIKELETIRDDLQMVSVKNAILLDSLAMAGVDV